VQVGHIFKKAIHSLLVLIVLLQFSFYFEKYGQEEAVIKNILRFLSTLGLSSLSFGAVYSPRNPGGVFQEAGSVVNQV